MHGGAEAVTITYGYSLLYLSHVTTRTVLKKINSHLQLSYIDNITF